MRVNDPEFLKGFRRQKCFVGNCKVRFCDAHHIRTRGAGGGDEPDNVIPLCRQHHIEVHSQGAKSFAQKYNLPISWEEGYPRRTDLDPQSK